MQSGPDSPESGQAPRAPTPRSGQELSPEQVMQQVAARLHEGHGKDGARLFLEACKHDSFPKGPPLLQWVIDTLGREDSARLFGAFAHYPCVCCAHGLENCEACGGQGVRPEGPFCDSCAATGKARCEFCDGAGLAAYSFFPEPLWLPVIIDRVRLASHQLDLLIAQPIPRISDPAAEANHVHLMLNLNKLIGVLENGVSAAREIAHHDPHRQAIANVVGACRQSAARANQYLRQVIRSLAGAIRQGARSLAADSAEAQFRESRAQYYDALAHTAAFEGTCLHHPFLYSSQHGAP